MDIIKLYKEYCNDRGIEFNIETSVAPYNDSTLFCPAGMQKHIDKFMDDNYIGTEANIQPCIRMNDFDEIGDSSHLLYFNMIGLFSFRQYTIENAIDFWMAFLVNELKLDISYVTIHNNRNEWREYYSKWNVEVRISDDCIWTDGNIGGYCTEFFIDDVEIGNIVNPLDNSIDAGFGRERIDMFVNNYRVNMEDTLVSSAMKIIESGYKPSNTKQGYVLRKILRQIYKNGWTLNHEFFDAEVERQNKILQRYNRLKDRFSHMPKEWWYETHGINIDEI